MTDYARFRDIVEATAVGDSDRAEALVPGVQAGERGQFHNYVTAVFSGMTALYFEDDSSTEAVRRFVDEMRHDYRNTETPFRPLAMEGLLRAFFGEEHLLNEIDALEQLRCEMLAIRKMVHAAPVISASLDRYLVDAETVAREWEAEDAQA